MLSTCLKKPLISEGRIGIEPGPRPILSAALLPGGPVGTLFPRPFPQSLLPFRIRTFLAVRGRRLGCACTLICKECLHLGLSPLRRTVWWYGLRRDWAACGFGFRSGQRIGVRMLFLPADQPSPRIRVQVMTEFLSQVFVSPVANSMLQLLCTQIFRSRSGYFL